MHYVRHEMDTGPVVGQAAAPVLPGDRAEDLAARVLAAGRRPCPHCLRLIAEGRVRIAGETADLINPDADPGARPITPARRRGFGGPAVRSGPALRRLPSRAALT